MTANMKKKIQQLESNITDLARRAHTQQGEIIQMHEQVRQTRHAMETVVAWVGEEMGEDAVARLNARIQSQQGGTDGIIVLP
jgi:uncharacterized hydantoinase/oxoprolinase family protein